MKGAVLRRAEGDGLLALCVDNTTTWRMDQCQQDAYYDRCDQGGPPHGRWMYQKA